MFRKILDKEAFLTRKREREIEREIEREREMESRDVS